MVEERVISSRPAKWNGVTGWSRARKFGHGSDGSFANAIWPKSDPTTSRTAASIWDWGSNPFVGSKELSGLAILNCLLSNWDAKTTNNNCKLGMCDGKGGVKDWYLVADWGGTFGKTGGLPVAHQMGFGPIIPNSDSSKGRKAARSTSTTPAR